MRLVVISHTEHRRDAGGELLGWAPTVRELDHLATLFDQVVHIAFLHEGEPLGNHRAYSNGRIRVRALRPAGGSLAGRLRILLRAPGWARAILGELRSADAIHVRCPANISLIAILLLAVVRRPRPRWIKYAGNWMPARPDAVSYRLQRWILRRNLPRGAVTVNGSWPDQPSHVRTFDNPCLTDGEVATARLAAKRKPCPPPLRLVFAGRLDDAKGAGRAIAVAGRLASTGQAFRLDLVGDGPDRARYEALVADSGLSDRVKFHGWLPREALDELYGAAHIVLLPSVSEGFPKVLAEAMAHGAVPVASSVSSIPQVLAEVGAGWSVPPEDLDGMVEAARAIADVEVWRRQSAAALTGAERFTYRRYLDRVIHMFDDCWTIRLERSVSSEAEG